MTLHDITLHYITLHCSPLLYIIAHSGTVNSVQHSTMQCNTTQYAIQYSPLHYMFTSHSRLQHSIVQPYITCKIPTRNIAYRIRKQAPDLENADSGGECHCSKIKLSSKHHPSPTPPPPAQLHLAVSPDHTLQAGAPDLTRAPLLGGRAGRGPLLLVGGFGPYTSSNEQAT